MKNSIYPVIYCIYLFGGLLGMAPFRMRISKGSFLYRKLKNYFFQMLIIILLSACMVYYQKLYMSLTKANNATEVLLRFFSWGKIFSAILTLLWVTFQSKHLAIAYERISQFDMYIRKLETKGNIHNGILGFDLFLMLCMTFGFPIAFGVLAYIYDGQTIPLIVYEALSRGLQCAIHSFVALYFNVFIVILFIRFHYLHKTLHKFVDEDNSLRSDPIVTLNYVCTMYAILCNGAQQFNKVFTVSLFFMVMINMLETLLSIYLVLMVRVSNEKMMVYGAYNITIVVVLLLPTGILHKKTKGLACYLTESSFCYKNETASIIRSSFMLQTLQEGIQFQACGCFSLSIATFIDQLSVCVSFLLFLYQLVNIPPEKLE